MLILVTSVAWELGTSRQLIAGLRARSSGTPPLDLITDLYDAESGLCGEGVWHNCWLGTACVLAARRLRRDAAPDAGVDRAIAASRQRVATPPPPDSDELFEAAVLLADSLHELSFDDGFRRRTASGVWRDAASSRAALTAAGEDPAFYAYSRERRSVQNGAAVVMCSLLADEAAARAHGDAARLAVRCDEVGSAFLELFHDARAGRFRRDDAQAGGARARAVDQAVASLACLRLARLEPRFCNTETARARDAAREAVASLLRDFGYGEYLAGGAPPRNHVGDFPGSRRRNSWHDALACFAIAAYAGAPGGGDLVSAEELDALRAAVRRDYAGADGLLVHQPSMLRAADAADDRPAVVFTCTQAIWAAVERAAAEVPRDDRATAAAATDPTVAAAAARHRASTRDTFAAAADADGLLPVANVYPGVRLWCNTEPAAWLLMERDDFAPEVPKPTSSLFGGMLSIV